MNVFLKLKVIYTQNFSFGAPGVCELYQLKGFCHVRLIYIRSLLPYLYYTPLHYMSSWSNFFGRRQYELLPTTNDPPQNIPGTYPAEESMDASPSTPSIGNRIAKWFIFLFIAPITVAAVVSLSLLSKFFSFLYLDDSEAQRRRSASETATTSCNALMNDPISKVERFVRALEENLLPEQLYSSNNPDRNVAALPPFFQGSYTQALYMAINRGKFLYVYLTNPSNESSSSIFDHIVTNPKFISIFTTENRNNQNIIWGGDLTNLEAYQLANSLNVTKFPFLGVLCLTRTSTMTPQGPSKTPPKISLILKIQGGIGEGDPDKLIQSKFIKRALKYEPELALIRAELKDKYMSEMVRKQQNADYQQSLLKDRQKKAQKAQKRLAADYLRWKQSHILELRLQQDDREGKARIAIKMAGGNRETFFFPENSPIEDIFLFVELHQKSLLEEESNFTLSQVEAEEKFRGFSYPYQFRLVSPAPPLPLLSDYDKSTPVKDVGFIYPSGLLMVERL